MAKVTTPIQKVANYVRMLSSEHDAELVMAARALIRTLHGMGWDIHQLADQIENPPKQMTEAEMKEIYDAAIIEAEHKLRAAKSNGHGAPSLRLPSAYDMVMFCHERLDQLDVWYQEFIPSVLAKRIRRGVPLSSSQQSKLEEAYLTLGGKTQ